MEGSGHPSNPTVNGKLGIKKEDDDDDNDSDNNDDDNENLNNYIPGKSSL